MRSSCLGNKSCNHAASRTTKEVHEKGPISKVEKIWNTTVVVLFLVVGSHVFRSGNFHFYGQSPKYPLVI